MSSNWQVTITDLVCLQIDGFLLFFLENLFLIQKRRGRQNQRQPTLKKHQNYVFKFVEAPVGLKNYGKSSIMSLKSSLCKDRSKMPKDVDIKQWLKYWHRISVRAQHWLCRVLITLQNSINFFVSACGGGSVRNG